MDPKNIQNATSVSKTKKIVRILNPGLKNLNTITEH